MVMKMRLKNKIMITLKFLEKKRTIVLMIMTKIPKHFVRGWGKNSTRPESSRKFVES